MGNNLLNRAADVMACHGGRRHVGFCVEEMALAAVVGKDYSGVSSAQR